MTSLESTSMLHGQQISNLEEENLALEVKVAILETADAGNKFSHNSSQTDRSNCL